MDNVRVGVIGCGVIGPRYAEVAASSSLMELAAVADLIPEPAPDTAAQHGACRV